MQTGGMLQDYNKPVSCGLVPRKVWGHRSYPEFLSSCTGLCV